MPHPFFAFNKHRSVMVMLICITIAITLTGGVIPYFTALHTAKFEFIFCVFYFFSLQKLHVLSLFKENKTFKVIFFVWLFLISLSMLQLFWFDISDRQFFLSKMRYLFTLMHIIFALCLISYLSKSKFSVQLALNTVPFSILFIAFIFFINFSNESVAAIRPLFGHPPFASNIRYIGYTCTVGGIISCFWLLQKHTNGMNSVLIFLLALINLSLLFWIAGRTAIACVTLVIWAYTFYLYKYSQISGKRLLLMLVLFICTILLVDQLSTQPWHGLNHVKAKFFGGDGGIASVNEISSGRLEIWKMSIEGVLNAPLLGYGQYSFSYLPGWFFGLHPHNMILQVLLEWGIIGGGVFLVLLIYSFTKAFKVLQSQTGAKRKTAELAYLILIALTLHALTDGIYYHAQPVYFLILAFSVFPALALKSK